MSCLAAWSRQDGLLWFHWWVILSEQSILPCYPCSAFPMNSLFIIFKSSIPAWVPILNFVWARLGNFRLFRFGVCISKSNCLDICFRSRCSSAWEMNFFMAGLASIIWVKSFCVVVLYANSLEVLCISNPAGPGDESLWQSRWQENITSSNTWLLIEVFGESASEPSAPPRHVPHWMLGWKDASHAEEHSNNSHNNDKGDGHQLSSSRCRPGTGLGALCTSVVPVPQRTSWGVKTKICRGPSPQQLNEISFPVLFPELPL